MLLISLFCNRAEALSLAVLFSLGILKAAPTNDAFSSAAVLAPALASPLSGDASAASYQADEVILDSPVQNGTIWFKWTPSTNGQAVPNFTWEEDLTATVNGSGFEMIVYQGTQLAALTPLARGSEGQPIERFAFTAGQTYYLQVHVSTDSSATTFPWSCEITAGTAAPAAPANDAFAGVAPISTTLPRSANGTTAGATLESGESIDAQRGRSVWYRHTAPANSTRRFALTSRSDVSDPVAEVFTGTTLQNLNRVGRIAAGGEILISSISSTTYFFRVWTEDSTSTPGPFTLTVSAPTAAPGPSNDAFSAATDLGSALNSPAAATTALATVEAGERRPMATNGTVWFKWTAAAAGWFSVFTESDDVLPGVSVWSGTSLANLKLRKSAGAGNAEAKFRMTTGEVVYFQVCAEGGLTGDFSLSVKSDVVSDLPQLLSATFSSASVDVTTAERPVSVTLTVAGPADGEIRRVYLLHPGGGVASEAETGELVQTSGSPGNGTYTAALAIPSGAAPGEYPLVVYLQNQDGTEVIYASTQLITAQSPLETWTSVEDIPSGRDSLTVTNTGAAATPPALTTFTVTPATADLGTGAAMLNFTAAVTGIRGVAAVTLVAYDPIGDVELAVIDFTRSSGTAASGSWVGSLTIPRYAKLSRMQLTLWMSDSIGQRRRFGMQPIGAGLADQFDGVLRGMTNAVVTFTNSLGPDDLPPQVSSVAVTPNPAIFGSDGTVRVAVSVRVKDSVSGTDEVYFSLETLEPQLLTRISGTPADGIYTGVLEVSREDASPGVLTGFFRTKDFAGNEGVISSIVPGIPVVTLQAPTPGTYDRWAFDNALSAPDHVSTANPESDGISNALKYAFNLDPTISVAGEGRVLQAGTGLSGLPSIRPVGEGLTTRLRVEYLRRLAAPGLTYAVEFASRLDGPSDWVTGTHEVVSPISATWERVVVEDLLGAGAERRFGRVRVLLNP